MAFTTTYRVHDRLRARERAEVAPSARDAVEQAARFWFLASASEVTEFERLEVFGNGGGWAFHVSVRAVPEFEVIAVKPDPPIPGVDPPGPRGPGGWPSGGW
jgi:hypothetical protein